MALHALLRSLNQHHSLFFVAIVYVPRAGTTSYHLCLASTLRGACGLAPINVDEIWKGWA